MIELVLLVDTAITGLLLAYATLIVYQFRHSSRLLHIAPMAISQSLFLIIFAFGTLKIYNWAAYVWLGACALNAFGFWQIQIRK